MDPWRRGDAGLSGIGLHITRLLRIARLDHRLRPGSGLRAALKRLQSFFELLVAVLQLLVLAGELPQLILKLLNAHFRVDGIGLRQSL